MTWLVPGPLALAVLVVGGFGLLVGLALTVLSALRRRVPLVLWLLVPALAGVVGAVASWSSAAQAYVAARSASQEMLPALAAAGLAEAGGGDALGHWVGALLLCLSAWGAAVGALRVAGPEPRFTLGAAALAVLGALGGGLGLAGFAVYQRLGLGAVLLALLVLVGGLGVGVAALRRSLDRSAQRVAAMRFVAAACLMLGVWWAGEALVTAATHAAVVGVGVSPDVAAVALAEVGRVSAYAWLAMAVATVVGVGGFLFELGEVVERGTLLDVLASAMVLGALAVVRLLAGGPAGALVDVALVAPVSELTDPRGTAELPIAVVATPAGTVDAATLVPGVGDLVVHGDAGWVRTRRLTPAGYFEDATPLAELSDPSQVVLVAPPGAPARAVVQALVRLEELGVAGRLLVRERDLPADAPAELRRHYTGVLPLTAGHDASLASEPWLAAGDSRLRFGAAYWDDTSPPTTVQIDQALSRIKVRQVHVALGASARVSDVVDACAAVVTKAVAGAAVWRDDVACNLLDVAPDALRAEALGVAAPAVSSVKVSARVRGQLTQDVVDHALAWQAAGLARCGAGGTAGWADLTAVVHVDPTGKVAGVDIGRTRANEAITACAVGRLQGMVLPAPAAADPPTDVEVDVAW